MKLKKIKPDTETEQLHKTFPNLDNIPSKIISDAIGNIIEIETKDTKLIKWAKENGLS